jgi:molybdate transport system substrate-binding protein
VARRQCWFAAAWLWVALAAAGVAPAKDVPVIAAAADLQFALPEVAERFRLDTGREVKLAFGSSGNFFRQIQQGAPYELFMSADEEFVLDLAAKGLALDEGEIYGIGRIGLFTPHGSPLTPDGTLSDLKAALADGRLKKFAIANPEHAPYGRRAEEALRHVGAWEAIKEKLVLGENASQAAQFATTGSVEGGIIPYSLALSPKLAKRGSFALIPQDWHRPLRQRMALLKGAGEAARAFYAFLIEPEARAILARHGFASPGEG